MESPCRHVFCKVCIETWLANHHNCPTCRRRLRTHRLKPVLPIVQNMINRLQISCDFTENGCEEILILEQYEGHLKVCDYQKLKCSFFDKCGEEVLRKDIHEHEHELCEFRQKRCLKQCGLMITISYYDTHDCFEELQKFASDSTTLVETLKKSIKELTELTQSMKKNVEDLTREVERRRSRSSSASPFYSLSGNESDHSNFMLDDNSNDGYSDDYYYNNNNNLLIDNNNTSIRPPRSSALQMVMDQRTVRLRGTDQNGNVIGGNLIQLTDNQAPDDSVNNRNSRGNAIETVTFSNVTGDDGIENITATATISTPAQHDNAGDGAEQSNIPAVSFHRPSIRSRSHIWDSDVSVLSSSSSPSSSSSDDDIGRDFGIDHRDSYSFSSTPVNSPDRSIRSLSSSASGSTIHDQDQGSPIRSVTGSSTRDSNRNLSEVDTDDDGNRSCNFSRSEFSASPASSNHSEGTYSGSDHNQSVHTVDSRSGLDTSTDRSSHYVGDSRRDHNSNAYSESDPNSSIENSNYAKESRREQDSVMDRSFGVDDSRSDHNSTCNKSREGTESSERTSYNSSNEDLGCGADGHGSHGDHTEVTLVGVENDPQSMQRNSDFKTTTMHAIAVGIASNVNNNIISEPSTASRTDVTSCPFISPTLERKKRKHDETNTSASPSLPKKRFIDTADVITNTSSAYSESSVPCQLVPCSAAIVPNDAMTHSNVCAACERASVISRQEQVYNSDDTNPMVSVITSPRVKTEINCATSDPINLCHTSGSDGGVKREHGELKEKNEIPHHFPVPDTSNLSDQDDCIVTGFSQGPVGVNVPLKLPVENRSMEPNLDTTFDLRDYHSDTDDTWEPQGSGESDYYGMSDSEDSSYDLRTNVNDNELVAADNSSPRSDSSDTWEPRHMADRTSNTDDDTSRSFLSDFEVDSDSSYEVRIPLSVAQLLDKYASEDHDSDDSWTPH